jgi:zinc-finger of transposase IS204/IS1001/IS1096/IS1165
MRPRPFCEDLDRQDSDHHERPWRFIVLHVCTAGEAGLLVILFPHLAGLDVARVEDTGEGGRITARTATMSLACRGCAVVSARVHDRYWRRPADLGCGGRPERVVLQVRRFRCGNPACPVKTFAEQVPGLTACTSGGPAGGSSFAPEPADLGDCGGEFPGRSPSVGFSCSSAHAIPGAIQPRC